jgi:hypothetical protein
MPKIFIPILAVLALTAAAEPAAAVDCDTVEAMHQPSDSIREIFHVAGDAPDPTGATGLEGMSPGYDLRKHAAGRVMCHYSFGNGGEMIAEIDVYQIPGEPMRLHLICPHCTARDPKTRNALNVSADRKQMSFDPAGLAPAFPGWSDAQMARTFPRGTGGLLSVADRFRCSWEIDPRHRELIGNVCDFEVVIEKNVIRRVTHNAGGLLGRRITG